MSYLTLGAQTVLFAVLLPVYSTIYMGLYNRLHPDVVDPFPMWSRLDVAVDQWLALSFRRPFQASFSIAASATTVFAVSFLAWWFIWR